MAGPRAVFSVMGPDLPTEEFSVGSETFTIGRTQNNNLPLNQQKVSRNHAEILYKGSFFAIQDMGSSNGTYVNDVRLEPNKLAPLEVGDVIRIGPFALTLTRIEQESAAPVVAPTAKHVEQEEVPPPPAVVPTTDPPMVPPDGQSTPITPSGDGSEPYSPAVYHSEPGGPAEPGLTSPSQRTVPPPVPHDGASNGHARVQDGMEIEIFREARPPAVNGHVKPLIPYVPIDGIPSNDKGSRYVQYLPGVYSDSDFLKRYLLIMESILAPLEWGIDSFEQYYNPLVTTPDWLQWIGSWFDILVHPSIPEERQRAVVKELSILYLQRGTRKALSRLLELYFGVMPEIVEHDQPPSSFTVRLPLGKEDSPLMRSLAQQLITVCKPAHTGFTLEVT